MLFIGSFSDTHPVNVEVAKCVPTLYLNFLIPEQLGAVAQLFVLVYFHLFLASKTHWKTKNIHLGHKNIHIW